VLALSSRRQIIKKDEEIVHRHPQSLTDRSLSHDLERVCSVTCLRVLCRQSPERVNSKLSCAPGVHNSEWQCASFLQRETQMEFQWKSVETFSIVQCARMYIQNTSSKTSMAYNQTLSHWKHSVIRSNTYELVQVACFRDSTGPF
jgi:hypothetical protein